MKILSFLALSSLLILSSPGQAQTATTWIGTEPAPWSDPSKWSGGEIPDNGQPDPGDTYHAHIDYGNTVILDRDVTLDTLHLSSGILQVSGAHTLNATTTIRDFTIGGDAIALTGETRLGGPDSTASTLRLQGNGSRFINGRVFHQNTSFIDEESYNGEIMLNSDATGLSSVFHNATGAIFNSNAIGAEAVNYISSTPSWDASVSQFINDGIFNKTGSGTTHVSSYLRFNNAGKVEVFEGVLDIGGGNHSGSFVVDSTARLTFNGENTFSEGSRVAGEGQMEISLGLNRFKDGSSVEVQRLIVNGGTAIFEEESTLLAEHLTVDGGEIQLDSHFIGSGASLYYGRIDGLGDLTLDGEVEIGTFTFGGSGIRNLLGTTILGTTEREGYLTVEGKTEVSNSGLFIQSAGYAAESDQFFYGDIVLTGEGGEDKAVFRNAGTFTSFAKEADDYNRIDSDSIDESNLFINEGLFRKTGKGSTIFGETVELQNTGFIEISEGTLTFEGRLTGTGDVILSGGTFAQHFGANEDLTERINVRSELGADDTARAILREGVTSEATVLEVAFVAEPGVSEYFTEGETRLNDILSLSSDSAPFIFALEMSLERSISNGTYLGWMDETGLWVNAVEGNSAGEAVFFSGTFDDFRLAYTGNLEDYLGYWGNFDGHAWAIIDHHSEFAVIAIPEPETWALLLGSFGAMLAFNRRRG